MIQPKILGVCAWLSSYFEIDVSTIRLLFIITAIIGLGSPILVYLILAVVKP